MQRCKEDGFWSLFCPMEAPGLPDCFGDEFDALYCKYEEAGKARRRIKARDLWFAILEAQVENGIPYLLYKDAANRKSNQQNLGVIQCSNLCTEIMEYTSPEEVAVCNLASICLPRFLSDQPGGSAATRVVAADVDSGRAEVWGGGRGGVGRLLTGAGSGSAKSAEMFDHLGLFEVTKVITRNLNKIIDTNRYPVPEAKTSNLRHRPIGIGVQGLADVFMRLRMPFESDEARRLNRDIFETIYFGALSASCELAKLYGPYQTYKVARTRRRCGCCVGKCGCCAGKCGCWRMLCKSQHRIGSALIRTDPTAKMLCGMLCGCCAGRCCAGKCARLASDRFGLRLIRSDQIARPPSTVGTLISSLTLLIPDPKPDCHGGIWSHRIPSHRNYWCSRNTLLPISHTPKPDPHTAEQGSPASKGVLQYDMWGVTPSSRWDWKGLKEEIALHGLRNSLTVRFEFIAVLGVEG
jgi:ribonucleotide reductase alpha subunit